MVELSEEGAGREGGAGCGVVLWRRVGEHWVYVLSEYHLRKQVSYFLAEGGRSV